MRQPLLIIGLLGIAGFGTYRAFKYGVGIRRFLGALPIIFLVVSGLIVPLVIGVMQGAGARPRAGGIAGDELILVAVVGNLILAVVSGAILALVFRPPKA
jgi:hypothetical protein